MSLTRKCEACGLPITTRLFLDLHVSVYETEGPETQDAKEQSYGDYCNKCVRSGEALKSVLSGLSQWAL